MKRNPRALAALAVLAVAIFAGPATADELSTAYRQVLLDPTDSEVNLQYALVAEGNRKWRLALAAYERILANDPGNAAAQAGLQRVRRIIEPPWTRVRTEVGATYTSNPLEDPNSPNPEGYAFGSLRVTDERNAFGTRWRSAFNLYGEGHFEQSDLSNITASVDTGPVWDLPGAFAAIHPAIGAAAGYFENRFAYSEVNLSATVEGYLDGAMQWARVRGGYRRYDPFFRSDAGFYAGVDGRLVHKVFTEDRDVVSVAPWFLWSDINGYVLDSNSTQISPGRYTAGGLRLEYDVVLSPHLSVGPFADFGTWLYATDPSQSGGRRRDLLVSPGIKVLFRNLFAAQTDLRLTYRYSHNDSNDPAHDYVNQAVTLALVTRR